MGNGNDAGGDHSGVVGKNSYSGSDAWRVYKLCTHVDILLGEYGVKTTAGGASTGETAALVLALKRVADAMTETSRVEPSYVGAINGFVESVNMLNDSSESTEILALSEKVLSITTSIKATFPSDALNNPGNPESGFASFVAGDSCGAEGPYSVAAGQNSVAYGQGSLSAGLHTVAGQSGGGNSNGCVALGQWNEPVDKNGNPLMFSIGCGSSEDDRKNLFSMRQFSDDTARSMAAYHVEGIPYKGGGGELFNRYYLGSIVEPTIPLGSADGPSKGGLSTTLGSLVEDVKAVDIVVSDDDGSVKSTSLETIKTKLIDLTTLLQKMAATLEMTGVLAREAST